MNNSHSAPDRAPRKLVRLSIYLRLRREELYRASAVENWNSSATSWSSYWYVNDIGATSFSERCQAELTHLKDKGNFAAVSQRRKAIKLLTKEHFLEVEYERFEDAIG